MKANRLILLVFLTSFFLQCKKEKKKVLDKPKVEGHDKIVKVIDTIFLDSVWAANKVSFDLHTIENQQFVAYYDKNRMMTVASRELGSTIWNKKTLPNKLHWDSHNYVTMGFDEKGHIHISGNMHANPLVYFRSEKPFDVQSIIEVNSMTGQNEDRVTYPKFFNNRDGSLFYSYRRGGSGNGNVWVNQYSLEEKKWNSFLPKGLFKGIIGETTRSAYHRFAKGPAGNFHYIWMWRWTPAVETSHQLCYATSSDFLNWKNSSGESIQLPFTPDNEKLIIDDVPSKGGLHNGKYDITFLKNGSPIIGYIKYDSRGLTQLYLCRFEHDKWISKKISDWNFRWKFIGGGDQMSQGASFDFAGVSEKGLLAIDWSNEKGESGRYVINPKTLQHSGEQVDVKLKYPPEIHMKLTDDPTLSVNLQQEKVRGNQNGLRYVLKWESRGKSHGRHAPKIIPKTPISPLYIIEIL